MVINDRLFRKDVEAVVAYIEVLHRHLSGRTEENRTSGFNRPANSSFIHSFIHVFSIP